VLDLGWTKIDGLLFVSLYFYTFNQQWFWAEEFQIPPYRQSLSLAAIVYQIIIIHLFLKTITQSNPSTNC
jgi:hypothetical protein